MEAGCLVCNRQDFNVVPALCSEGDCKQVLKHVAEMDDYLDGVEMNEALLRIGVMYAPEYVLSGTKSLKLDVASVSVHPMSSFQHCSISARVQSSHVVAFRDTPALWDRHAGCTPSQTSELHDDPTYCDIFSHMLQYLYSNRPDSLHEVLPAPHTVEGAHAPSTASHQHSKSTSLLGATADVLRLGLLQHGGGSHGMLPLPSGIMAGHSSSADAAKIAELQKRVLELEAVRAVTIAARG